MLLIDISLIFLLSKVSKPEFKSLSKSPKSNPSALLKDSSSFFKICL